MCVGATGGSGGVLYDHQNIKALSASYKSRGFVSVPKWRELWLLLNLFTRGEGENILLCIDSLLLVQVVYLLVLSKSNSRLLKYTELQQ